MLVKLEFAIQLRRRLDQIERCLVLAETVANVLQSDSHLEHDNIVRLLGAEAIAASDALAEIRRHLEDLQCQDPASSVP